MRWMKRFICLAAAVCLAAGGIGPVWADPAPYEKHYEYVLSPEYGSLTQVQSWTAEGFDLPVVIGTDIQGRMGLFDLNGIPLTGMNYESMIRFSDKSKYFLGERDGLFVALDEHGKETGFSLEMSDRVLFQSETVMVVLPYYPQSNTYGEEFTVYAYDGTELSRLPFSEYQNVSSDGGVWITFNDDLYVYRNPQGKCGAVDPAGKSVIEAKYDDLTGFSNGTAWAKQGDKYGLIDKMGTVILPFEYDTVQRYQGEATVETVTLVSKGEELGIVDNALKYTRLDGVPERQIRQIDVENQRIVTMDWERGISGLVDYSGRPVLEKKYRGILPLCGGYYQVTTDNGMGVARRDGTFLLEPIYDNVTAVSEGLCGYSEYDAEAGVSRSGFVDETGKIVLTLADGLRPVYSFTEGFAIVQQDGEMNLSYIDLSGSVVMSDPQWHHVQPFHNGVAVVSSTVDAHIQGTVGMIRDKPNAPSEWAREEVTEAEERGLIPEGLKCRYQQEITRAEFAETAVQTVAVLQGKTVEELVAANQAINVFTDTDSVAVNCARQLGIVDGMGDGTFEPSRGISRQEAAKMLMSAYCLLGDAPAVPALSYADAEAVADWAKGPVGQVTAIGIMKGMGENRFEPLLNYTREQSFVTFLRMAKAAGK